MMCDDAAATSRSYALNGLDRNIPLLFGTMLFGSSIVDRLFTIPDGKIISCDAIDAITQLAHRHHVAVDTAEGYSDAETRLGDSMKRTARQLHISTKFLPTLWRFTQGSFLSALDQSLLRLKVNCIDCYFLHTPTHPCSIETWVYAAHVAYQQKKIRAFGVSNCNADQLRAVTALADTLKLPIAANQFQLSLLVSASPKVQETLKVCRETKVTPVCFGLLGQGLLSKEDLTVEEAKKSRMLWITGADYERDVVPLRAAIKTIAADRNAKIHDNNNNATRNAVSPVATATTTTTTEKNNKITMAHVCLAWGRAKGVVPLVGTRKVEHLQEAIDQQRLLPSLTEQEIATLDSLALGRHTFEKSSARRAVFVFMISIMMSIYRLLELASATTSLARKLF